MEPCWMQTNEIHPSALIFILSSPINARNARVFMKNHNVHLFALWTVACLTKCTGKQWKNFWPRKKSCIYKCIGCGKNGPVFLALNGLDTYLTCRICFANV